MTQEQNGDVRVFYTLRNQPETIAKFLRSGGRYFSRPWKFFSDQRQRSVASASFNGTEPFVVQSGAQGFDGGSRLIFDQNFSRQAREIVSLLQSNEGIVDLFINTNYGRTFIAENIGPGVSPIRPEPDLSDRACFWNFIMDHVANYERIVWLLRRSWEFQKRAEGLRLVLDHVKQMVPILKAEATLSLARQEALANFLLDDGFHRRNGTSSLQKREHGLVVFSVWVKTEFTYESDSLVPRLETAFSTYAQDPDNGVKNVEASANRFYFVVDFNKAHRLVEFLSSQEAVGQPNDMKKLDWFVNIRNVFPWSPQTEFFQSFFHSSPGADSRGQLNEQHIAKGYLPILLMIEQSYGHERSSEEKKAFHEILNRYQDLFIEVDSFAASMSMYRLKLKMDEESIQRFMNDFLREVPGVRISNAEEDHLRGYTLESSSLEPPKQVTVEQPRRRVLFGPELTDEEELDFGRGINVYDCNSSLTHKQGE